MKRKHLLILDGILIALLPFLFFASKGMLLAFPACSYAEKGWLCPSCGGTRFVLYLTSGRWSEAFQVHPYFFLTAFLILIVLALWHLAVLTRKPKLLSIVMFLLKPCFVVVWAIGYGVFGILRLLFAL